MVEGLVVAAVVILYIGFEFGLLTLILKGAKENKTKTSRQLMPWSSMAPIQKTTIIALYSLMIVFFFWLYNYSILGPKPGELYNFEILLIGVGIILSIVGSLWMLRT